MRQRTTGMQTENVTKFPRFFISPSSTKKLAHEKKRTYSLIAFENPCLGKLYAWILIWSPTLLIGKFPRREPHHVNTDFFVWRLLLHCMMGTVGREQQTTTAACLFMGDTSVNKILGSL